VLQTLGWLHLTQFLQNVFSENFNQENGRYGFQRKDSG
jgi:hypothetical protein